MGAVTRPSEPGTSTGPGRRPVLLLGLGAGAALLGGCTLNNPYSSHQRPAAEAVRDLAPDVGVAVQAVAVITAAQRELAGLVASRPASAARLSGLTAAYQAYADALRGAVPKGVEITGDATPTPTPGAPSPGVPGGTVSTARRSAATVHARLTGFALRAESGSFARLLGSMAAGLSQQLVAL